MGITIFLALCVMAVGFLVYVLVQFVREGRRRKMTRRPSSLYRGFPAGDAGTHLTRRKVIQITVPD
jgi:hypothetical protein